jgi:hypothetical protein
VRFHPLLSARADDTDTASGDIPEADVEAAEVGTDNEEHAERLLRVLDLGQEARVEAERQRDL